MERKEEILQLIYKNEVALSQLYELFAQKFPQKSAFWQKLVLDEKEHAKWIGKLARDLETQNVFIDEKRFPPQALSTFYNHIQKLIIEAKTTKVELIKALSSAVDCERALIERRYFETFTSDSEQIKNTFKLLKSSTEDHVRYVEEEWTAEKHRLGIP